MYLEKNMVQKDTCILMFIAALFTIAKTCNQPTYPFTNELIKMWYAYIHTYILWNITQPLKRMK